MTNIFQEIRKGHIKHFGPIMICNILILSIVTGLGILYPLSILILAPVGFGAVYKLLSFGVEQYKKHDPLKMYIEEKSRIDLLLNIENNDEESKVKKAIKNIILQGNQSHNITEKMTYENRLISILTYLVIARYLEKADFNNILNLSIDDTDKIKSAVCKNLTDHFFIIDLTLESQAKEIYLCYKKYEEKNTKVACYKNLSAHIQNQITHCDALYTKSLLILNKIYEINKIFELDLRKHLERDNFGSMAINIIFKLNKLNIKFGASQSLFQQESQKVMSDLFSMFGYRSDLLMPGLSHIFDNIPTDDKMTLWDFTRDNTPGARSLCDDLDKLKKELLVIKTQKDLLKTASDNEQKQAIVSKILKMEMEIIIALHSKCEEQHLQIKPLNEIVGILSNSSEGYYLEDFMQS